MAKTSNERVAVLLKTLNIDEVEAANRIGKPYVTIHRIIDGTTKNPTKSTLKEIANGLGANYDWLLSGKGEILKDKEILMSQNPWKEALVADLKSQIEYLKELLKISMQGKPANFLKATENASAKIINLAVSGAGLSETA